MFGNFMMLKRATTNVINNLCIFKEQANIAILQERILKSSHITNSIDTILNTFEQRLSRLEDTILPVYNETENLQKCQHSILLILTDIKTAFNNLQFSYTGVRYWSHVTSVGQCHKLLWGVFGCRGYNRKGARSCDRGRSRAWHLLTVTEPFGSCTKVFRKAYTTKCWVRQRCKFQLNSFGNHITQVIIFIF